MFSSALAKHCRDISPPCHITVLSGISSLPGEKHRWHIGTDVFRTKWAMNILARPLATVHIPKREKCMSPLLKPCEAFLSAPLSLAVKVEDSIYIFVSVLINETFSKSVSLVPAWHQVLIVKAICCYILRLHGGTSKWTYGQRLWGCESHCN